MDSYDEVDNLKEELVRLQVENKKLLRQMGVIQSNIKRQKATMAARANVDAMLSEEKARQEEYMNLLLKNSLDIIVLFDKDGRFAYCSDTFLQQTGIESFGLINGHHFNEVFERINNWQLLETVEEAFAQTMDKKEPVRINKEIYFNGTQDTYSYAIVFTPMLDAQSNSKGALAIFHDTTEMTGALQRAERASEAKSLFLANMSHEMRTPLNAIIGMIAIADRTDAIEEKNRCIKKVDAASKHLLNVINDVLDMSKIEANHLELSCDEFALSPMIEKIVDVFSFSVAQKNQILSVEVDPKIPYSIISDEKRLSQVVTNLLSNAVKFTPNYGKVHLKVELAERKKDVCTLLISVSDSGIGISKEQQELLFKSFVQADNNISRRFGGTGLGLAIAKNIIELMGGKIWIDSQLGQGACFKFTIEAKCTGVNRSVGEETSGECVFVVDTTKEGYEHFMPLFKEKGPFCYWVENEQEAAEYVLSARNTEGLMIFFGAGENTNVIELVRQMKSINAKTSVVVVEGLVQSDKDRGELLLAGVDAFVENMALPDTVVDYSTAKQVSGLEEDSFDNIFEGKCALLVEDVEINQEIVIALLEHTGLEFACVSNGSEAVNAFSECYDKFDIIMMDIHMPEMDGFEATRKIRALDLQKAKDIPIIAMTANVFSEDIRKCLESGMNDHVGKPIDVDIVLGKLRQWLKKKH